MEDHEARTEDRCEVGMECCAPRILDVQPDFVTEKSFLETVNLEASHEFIFYPMPLCELNDI